MRVIRDYFAIVAMALLMTAILMAACGCKTATTAGAMIEHSPDGSAVTVTLDNDKKLPDSVTVKSGEDGQDYVPPEDAKREAQTFPIGVFLGWLIPAGALCVAAHLFGAKPMIPIIAGGGIIVATAMAVSLAFWEILLSLLALAVLAGLVFGLMWLRRSRMLAELVTKLQAKRDTDPAFKAAMNESVKLDAATSGVVDKIKGKKK